MKKLEKIIDLIAYSEIYGFWTGSYQEFNEILDKEPDAFDNYTVCSIELTESDANLMVEALSYIYNFDTRYGDTYEELDSYMNTVMVLQEKRMDR